MSNGSCSQQSSSSASIIMGGVEFMCNKCEEPTSWENSYATGGRTPLQRTCGFCNTTDKNLTLAKKDGRKTLNKIPKLERRDFYRSQKRKRENGQALNPELVEKDLTLFVMERTEEGQKDAEIDQGITKEEWEDKQFIRGKDQAWCDKEWKRLMDDEEVPKIERRGQQLLLKFKGVQFENYKTSSLVKELESKVKCNNASELAAAEKDADEQFKKRRKTVHHVRGATDNTPTYEISNVVIPEIGSNFMYNNARRDLNARNIAQAEDVKECWEALQAAVVVCNPLLETPKKEADPGKLGWGSLTCRSSEYMVEFVVRALMHCNQRAIVLGGWAALSMESLKRATKDVSVIDFAFKNVLFVEKVPHEWLLPQVACSVHHGGAGTTVSAMRAGVPTIITPIWIDQYEFAYLVNQLGVGIGMTKQFQKTTPKDDVRRSFVSIGGVPKRSCWYGMRRMMSDDHCETRLTCLKILGDAINKVIGDSEIVVRASDMGARLSAEDGTSKAVISIEAFWDDVVRSGDFYHHIECTFRRSSPARKACCTRRQELNSSRTTLHDTE